MKKAVIATGGKQYLVSEGQVLDIDPLKLEKDKTAELPALLVIDGEKTSIGHPNLDGLVSVKIIESDVAQDKVKSIRYKAKKRIHTVRGHRQKLDKVEILKIKA